VLFIDTICQSFLVFVAKTSLIGIATQLFNKMMKNRNFAILAFCIYLTQFSCKEEKKTVKDTFSSPKTLFVEYVSAYTTGFISRNSEITVKLTKPVEVAVPGQTVDMKIFTFDPAIKGKTYWADDRTIIFKPETALQSGQRYNITFLLNKLLETPQDRGEFKFTFECIPQNFDVKIEGLFFYDNSDLTKVKIGGIIQTADEVANEQVEKIVQASQNGSALQISFEHGVGQNTHRFFVENVLRADTKGSVKIEWEGSAIAVNKKGEEKYEIPALDDFKVTSVTVERTGEQYISVKFSDPIDDKQNLRGIVMLSQGTAPRVVVNLNELKVYSPSSLAGDVELTIDQSVKNSAGYALGENFHETIHFSQQKPETKITANQGVIMPSSEGLIVPFKAVGLSAVDLTIVRIFENNVLQYLQVNDPGGAYQLQRVGRPVVRKTIPLTMIGVVNLNEWNNYSVDIADYVKVEPGAFYQVKIGFRKVHSLYFCPDSDNNADELIEDWSEEYEETTNWDGYNEYYDDYYYYDYSERNNPCHDAYYRADRGDQKIVFASDIGLIAKKAEEGALHVFSTNLISTAPMAGVTIEAYDFQQQPISSGTTDNSGKLQLQLNRKPYVLLAKKDKQFGYLKVDDGSSLSLSNFNVTGSRIQKGLKGFIYGERGVWRPSDTLHLTFILDDIQNRLPQGHPVILEMYNPLGQLHSRSVQSASLNGIFTFKPSTPKDAPTGNWNAKVKVGGATFNKQIKIETVKPNRLKIDLKFDEEMLYEDRGTQYANLNVRWLHGATARNLKASYEVLLVPTKTTFKNYDGLNFDDPSKEYITESEQIFEGRLDDNGVARLPFKLQTGDDPPGMVRAIFKGKVFEEGGDFSIDNTSVPYVPYKSFVGIQTPQGDKRGMLVTDSDHSVRVVSLDARGNPVSRNLEISVYKLRWRWWWDNSYEDKSNFASTYYAQLVTSGKVRTDNKGEGIYKLNIKYPEWGRYLIKAKDPDSGHSTGEIAYIDWPGWAGKQKRGELGGATMLSFNVEKEEVSVGDYIRLNIPSSADGRALISLETGSEVLQTFWVETKAENTNVEFEATSAMSPNIYAHVTMIQPHAQSANDLPIRMYGVEAIEVKDPDTQLSPVISMPDELRSGQEFTVQVNEGRKKPMTYTIAIVEDGLLDLTKFKTPEPWKTFYAREALGVKTWDIFDDVMGAYGGRLEKLMAIGGDDELKAPDANEANRFKPVVMFQGPFFIKAGQKGEHKFKLPQYIGSVRAMVIAGYEGAYGQAEKTIPVKQPLMILATLPRVAGPNEDITLPVNVFVMDEKIKNVELVVKTDGKLSSQGTSKMTVNFTETGDKVVYFSLKAAASLGVGKIKVEAKSGTFEAAYDVEMQVRASNPLMTQVTETILEGGKNWQVDYNPLGLITTNEGVFEISSLPPINLEQRLKYLIQFPHGCLEQTTSAVFAQLYLNDLLKLDSDRASKVQININAAIERMRSFQLSDGAFSYWPGNSQPNLWGTNYAGHFLVEARKQGYMVPEDILSKWVTYQQDQANNWNIALYSDVHTQAYRLYGLALAGYPSLGAMNRLKGSELKNKTAQWMLASAYAIAGYKDAALELIAGLSSDVREYKELGGTFGSTQRDQAIILETLVRLDKKTDAFEMIRKISEKMGNPDYWMSTQATAYCLIGIAEFAKNFQSGSGVNVALNVAGNQFRVDGDRYLNQVTLIEPDKKSNITMTNNGENPLFVRLIRTGVPLEGMEEASESNINMVISYKNMQGQAIDISELKQGTDFYAEITVSNPGMRGDYEQLAVTQIFPSGWEILNNRLDDTDQLLGGFKPTYQDLRDDRVMTYFDLAASKKATFKIFLNASYQGTYYQPAVTVEAMYDNSIAANTKGKWVKVVK
jgi:alpha-2-macroglobulin